MSSIRFIIVTMCAGMLTATTTFAQPPGKGGAGQWAKIARQRQARAAQVRRAQEKQHDVQKLEDLIQDLQAGKHVDPAELDRVLRDATR